MGPSTSRVLLFQCDAKARTHDSAGRFAALANSNAPQRRVCKTSVILRKLKVRSRLPGTVINPKTQVLIKFIGLDHFPRVHFPLRVPKRLEAGKGFHDFRADHFRKRSPAALPLAVFAGKRPAE